MLSLFRKHCFSSVKVYFPKGETPQVVLTLESLRESNYSACPGLVSGDGAKMHAVKQDDSTCNSGNITFILSTLEPAKLHQPSEELKHR